jgi:hypothetical protein
MDCCDTGDSSCCIDYQNYGSGGGRRLLIKIVHYHMHFRLELQRELRYRYLRIM